MSVCPSVCDGSALVHYKNPPMSVTAAPYVAEIPDPEVEAYANVGAFISAPFC